VPDENGLDEPKPVQFAGRNLVLLFGRQNLDGYASLRIAQVIRNQTGGYVLNPEFIPPLLNLAASTTLLNLVKRLVEILGAKSEALSGTRRSRGKTLADFNVSETGSFWLLHTVNTYLPELKHIHDVRRGHPEPLYLSLLKMAGALSTFSFEDNTRNLPAYDHDNLGPCFAALEMAVRDLLDTVIPSKCVNIPLKQNQRIWSGAITNDAWLQNSQMILAIAAPGMGVTDLIERVRMLVKLSPPDEINNLISHALPALKLVHASPPPAAVPNRSDFQYFTVNQAGRLWDGIQRSRSLSLYVPLDLPGARPEIYIVLP
jgi:type VI secretion system protein ImpJ